MCLRPVATLILGQERKNAGYVGNWILLVGTIRPNRVEGYTLYELCAGSNPTCACRIISWGCR